MCIYVNISIYVNIIVMYDGQTSGLAGRQESDQALTYNIVYKYLLYINSVLCMVMDEAPGCCSIVYPYAAMP